jgi:microcompartment protein CcmK/EutM
VVGTVVSTKKDEKLVGTKLQVVESVNIETLELEGKVLVAVDTVGAGEGELVLIATGSSARQTPITRDTPVDTAIVAIVDSIQLKGEMKYSSSR